MAQVIKNPFFNQQKELAAQQPNRQTRKCLSMREPFRKFCYAGTFLSAVAIIFVIFTKMTKQCPGWTPYALCVANRHCAYLQKNEVNSYMDLLPFVQEGGRCIARNDYQDYLNKGVESTIDFVNWLSGGDSEDPEKSILDKTKEIITPTSTRTQSQRKKLLSQFQYYYDDEIFLKLTRFEFGLWLIFVMFFFMRKAMDTCGRRKTVFDFMRPAKAGEKIDKGGFALVTGKPGEQGMTVEEIRKAREEALKKKRK